MCTTTRCSKIYDHTSLSLILQLHMRFYFWKEAALIKRFNCLSACLMLQLLHLLQAQISLLLQFSRFPSILRLVLNQSNPGNASKYSRLAFFSSCHPDKSNRLLIFHPQRDQAPLSPFSHGISCPLTPIPWPDRSWTTPTLFNQPVNTQTTTQLQTSSRPQLRF